MRGGERTEEEMIVSEWKWEEGVLKIRCGEDVVVEMREYD